MGISGPLVSLAIGSGCLTSAHALGWCSDRAGDSRLAALVWLGTSISRSPHST
jgi:hypothetical protein